MRARMWLRVGAASLLALSAGGGCGPAERVAASPLPNVLLVTLDTTRADHLGCYGYARNTSPNLDALARESQVFTRAWSTSNWTLPAHASLFTGLMPTSHGATASATGSLVLSDVTADARHARHRARALDPLARTLAESLRERGYSTAAVVAGPWLKRIFGLDRGFERWDDGGIQSLEGRSAEDVTLLASDWLPALERPYLLFLNYYDAHAPYQVRKQELVELGIGTDPPPAGKSPSTPSAPGAELARALYDGEIRYMDRHLGRLFARIRELDEWESTWIVVTADHGEMLGEHQRWGHEFELYEPVVRIPLIIKHPGRDGPRGRVDTPTSITDVLPIFAAGLDLELSDRVRGRIPTDDGKSIVAETWSRADATGAEPSEVATWRVIVRGDWKYHERSGEDPQLFHVGQDPGEITDVSRSQEERTRGLGGALHAFVAELPPPAGKAPAEAIDEATLESLRSLGYVD